MTSCVTKHRIGLLSIVVLMGFDMTDAQRWNDVFGCIDLEHWYFYSFVWWNVGACPQYHDFDLMNIGGGPL